MSEERKKKTGVDYPECALAVGTVERSADRRQSHRHGTQKQGVPRLGIVTKMRKWFGKSTSKKGGDVTPKSQQTPPVPTAQAGSKAQTPARKGPASAKGQPVKSSSQTTVDTTRSDQRSRPSSPDESFEEDDDQPSRRSLTPCKNVRDGFLYFPVVASLQRCSERFVFRVFLNLIIFLKHVRYA